MGVQAARDGTTSYENMQRYHKAIRSENIEWVLSRPMPLQYLWVHIKHEPR